MIRIVLLVTMAAGPAGAHGSLPGGGGFASGLAHPFLAGDHLLLLVALGGVLGRLGSPRPILALLVGVIGGYGLTTFHSAPLQPAILMLSLVLGGLLAAAILVRPAIAGGLALVAGGLVGADTDGPTGPEALFAYAGATTAMLVITLNSMALAQFGASRLDGVPLRVAGSWIAAAALLVLAIRLRGVIAP